MFFKHPDTFQKLLRDIFQVIGYIATVGLAAFLILAWMLTVPFFRLGV